MAQARQQTIIIDFTGIKKTFNDIFYPLLLYRQRYLVLMGGAGSGKSVFTAKKVVKRIVKERGHKIAVFRKIAKTLKGSCFEEILGVINEWKLSQLFLINRSDMTVTFVPNGNRIVFLGMDDQEKLKSTVGITSAWIEEATELLPVDLKQVDLRIRGETPFYKQIILTFNPISQRHWLKGEYFDQTPIATEGVDGRYHINDQILTLKTTYQDNRFLDAEYIRMLSKLSGNMRQIYFDGEWGILEGLIYAPALVDKYPDVFDETIRGLDFGFNHPMVLMRLDLKDGEVYTTEEFYKTGHTTSDLIKAFKRMGIDKKVPIYADNAEPDRIEEIAREGYNILPTAKGPGSVAAGIDLCQSLQFHTKPENDNSNAERASYRWRVDKDGNAMDEPLKRDDHAMDAERGALWTHLGKPEPEFWIG